jgi:GNAT superfamily N-acetyltransferase
LTEVREDLQAFLSLPERVYAGDPFHVPGRGLHGAHRALVAFEDGEPVARIAAWRASSLGILGLFEALDGHPEAVEKLFREAIAWLDRETIVGPMDGDTWHRYRLNVGPFDEPPFLFEPYNPPYYESLWTANGFTVLERYYSKRVDPAAVVAFLEGKRNVAGYRLRSLDRERFQDELRTIYELSRRIFDRNFLYTEISEEDFLRLYDGAERLIDPELVLFAHAPDGEPVGFLFAYPDRGGAVDFKTLGILPEHRRSGVAAALFHEGHRQAVEKGYRIANHCLYKEGNPSGDLDGGTGNLLRTYHL